MNNNVYTTKRSCCCFVQKTARKDVVDHLTDTSKYTGSHKERFDDSGKGKGIDGRVDRPEQSGYVTGYKEKGTYDKMQEDTPQTE